MLTCVCGLCGLVCWLCVWVWGGLCGGGGALCFWHLLSWITVVMVRWWVLGIGWVFIDVGLVYCGVFLLDV